jgi:hypothetical protein
MHKHCLQQVREPSYRLDFKLLPICRLLSADVQKLEGHFINLYWNYGRERVQSHTVLERFLFTDHTYEEMCECFHRERMYKEENTDTNILIPCICLYL